MNVLYNYLTTIKNSFAAIRDAFKSSWGINYTDKETATYSNMMNDLLSILDKHGKRTTWGYAFENTEITIMPPLDFSSARDLNGTFSYCQNLTGDITIGHGSAFSGTFKSSPKIENVYITPSQDVYSITCESMFYGCTNLKNVEINLNEDVEGKPTGLVTVNYTFYGCSNLKTIKFIISKSQSSSTFAMNYTFYNCKNLVSLLKPVILTGLTSANRAFYNCSKLENVEFQGTLNISLDLSSCVSLTSDSLHTLMTTLADGVDGLILNIGSTNIQKLETDYPDDIPAAEEKGWAIT